ncbi:hypothetical protein B0O80DRAFT_501252 [Mortierella sp. GBAus27b]|nr:hypothetical protein BGX31_008323 [Mortierella sp. GBA43]KAI8349526.1 hypothetical protein B0O80DRAFT_501252 [Mortierella sp. GBAus27b]
MSQHQRSTSAPSLDATQSEPYLAFMKDLVSAFNSQPASSTSSSTLRTFFKGVDHEVHVDGRQMKQVVGALLHSDPAKINEIINILKAMPEPTTGMPGTTKSTKAKAKAVDTKEAAARTLTKEERRELDQELSEWEKVDKNLLMTQRSNDQATGIEDPASSQSPLLPSSWFRSDSSSPEPNISTESSARKNTTVRRSPSVSLRLFTLSRRKTLSSGEQIAKAAASLLATAAASEAKETTTTSGQNDKSPNLRRQSSMPIFRRASVKALIPTSKASLPSRGIPATAQPPTKAIAVSEPSQSVSSYLISTINSITKLILPFHAGLGISTFWWGYEIHVPHKSMEFIECVSNTTSTFFTILNGAITAIPGLSILASVARMISAWVGHQWYAIKAQDRGKGVIISATWILPVILALRPWDESCCDNTLSLESPTSQQRRILPRLGV